MSATTAATTAPSAAEETSAASSSCCTPDHSCSGGAATAGPAEGVRTVYLVAGMTCGHCRTTLTREIGAVEGVVSVEVDLSAGQVTVVSTGEPDDAVIAGVVDEAGYELTGRAG
ncbi:heavy-metal-associated domain-containing protein [Streptomyces pactum]|uniref:Heavy-metal-associated domain-containing protein n=1 Tax=Streptomyces pactum TaxID=68249 RepID=A0ABS0NLN3_9ACTN|nr:heavy-metal-associated domain-containing protein [Streptomyces pactum]MBH5336093.1 heavy-metal-associated domain-containing protein [Streptomyces pactum]